MVINVPSSSDTSKFFVSNVLIRSSSVDITISYYKPDLSIIEIGIFSEIPVAGADYYTHSISALPQVLTEDKEFESVSGAVTIGLMDETLALPGSWSFTDVTGKLISSVLHGGLVGVRQITVGSDTFSGNIVLKEGTNVVIDSEYDSVNDKTIITVSAAANDSLILDSDQAIFDALAAEFGDPITRINNIPPTDVGNFSLSGLDCTTVSSISGGLSIKNPCAKPCCDKSYLDAAYEQLAELNSRYARIVGFYTEAISNINGMQNKLAMLQLNTNIDL